MTTSGGTIPQHAGPCLRVQDAEGRGPYRPGMSRQWADPNGFDCPPWWCELGEDVQTAHAKMKGTFHWGCGFSSWEQLTRWFNERERRALDRLDYRLVRVVPDIVIATTRRQVVFGTLAPLAHVRPTIKLTSNLAEAA